MLANLASHAGSRGDDDRLDPKSLPGPVDQNDWTSRLLALRALAGLRGPAGATADPWFLPPRVSFWVPRPSCLVEGQASRGYRMGVLLIVGTAKGAALLRSDASRQSWDVDALRMKG